MKKSTKILIWLAWISGWVTFGLTVKEDISWPSFILLGIMMVWTIGASIHWIVENS